MNKKFKLIENDSIEINGHKLYRLRALIDFSDVKAGDLGGYIETENNLSRIDDCWIYDNAHVFGNACVYDSARVYDNACVFGNAKVYDNARVFGKACVYGDACIFDDTCVYDNACIYGNVRVYDNARIFGNARIFSNAYIYNNVHVYDSACVSGDTRISDNVRVYGNACVFGDVNISGNAIIEKDSDYIVFKNTWSSGKYFVYTRSNKMWRIECFYGTGDELIKKAYADSENDSKHYELYVNLVKEMEKLEK